MSLLVFLLIRSLSKKKNRKYKEHPGSNVEMGVHNTTTPLLKDIQILEVTHYSRRWALPLILEIGGRSIWRCLQGYLAGNSGVNVKF